MSRLGPSEEEALERALFARRPRATPPPFADVLAAAVRAPSATKAAGATRQAILAAMAVAACAAGFVASARGRDAARSLIVAEHTVGGVGGAVGGDRRGGPTLLHGVPEDDAEGVVACMIEPAGGSSVNETCTLTTTTMAALASYDPICAPAAGVTDTVRAMSAVAAGGTCEPEATGSVAGP